MHPRSDWSPTRSFVQAPQPLQQKPAPLPKSPNARLKNEVSRRKSLANGGSKVNEEGKRRSQRDRIAPLEWWRNEQVVYSRAESKSASPNCHQIPRPPPYMLCHLLNSCCPTKVTQLVHHHPLSRSAPDGVAGDCAAQGRRVACAQHAQGEERAALAGEKTISIASNISFSTARLPTAQRPPSAALTHVSPTHPQATTDPRCMGDNSHIEVVNLFTPDPSAPRRKRRTGAGSQSPEEEAQAAAAALAARVATDEGPARKKAKRAAGGKGGKKKSSSGAKVLDMDSAGASTEAA